MGEITGIEQTNKVNYFAQMGGDSSSGGDSATEEANETVEEETKAEAETDQDNGEEVIQPIIKNEEKKNLKLRMKKGKRKKKGKGKAKYEEQFKKMEGNLFDGKI